MMIAKVSEGEAALRKAYEIRIRPHLGDEWKVRGTKLVECERRATGIHVERIVSAVRRVGARVVVGLGVQVDYSLYGWVRTCGSTEGGILGYSVGLAHHYPQEPEWDMNNDDWVAGILADVNTYCLPFFREMDTPHKVIAHLRRRTGVHFHIGPVGEGACKIAAMEYAYIDHDLALRNLREALDTFRERRPEPGLTEGQTRVAQERLERDVVVVADFLAFLETRPELPKIRLRR